MSNSIVPLNKEIGNNVVISFKNMKRQTFDFSYEIMEYILAKANFNLAKKLYFTCKYFPYKIRLFLIDNLEYCDGIVLTNLSKELEFQNTVNPADFNDRVWLGDTIMTDYDNIILWIPKIERCPIRGLKIVDGFLSWNEFKILTKDGKVERLCIEKVVDSDGNMIAIEDICACVPNLYELCSTNTHVTQNSMKSISNSLNFTVKMKIFSMYRIDGLLNVTDYLEFMKKYGDSDSEFNVIFSSSAVHSEQRLKFFSEIKTELEKWPEPKPSFNDH